MQSTADKRIEAKKAEDKAKALRAKANALQAEAAYEQEWGAGEGSDATATAWEKYQEATNAAARAEKDAKDAKDALAHSETEDALRAAAKVKVRDYMLIEDILTQAATYPADITFGDLIDIASEAAADESNWRKGSEAAADWLVDRIDAAGGSQDSDAYEKIINRLDWLIEEALNSEIRPTDIL